MKNMNCVLAVGILGMFAAQVQAGIITFDGTIDSAVPPAANGTFTLDYSTASPGANTFRTQGFLFNGFTGGVTPSNTQPLLSIVLDPSQCPTLLGISCISDGSHYLGTEDPFGFFPAGGGHFSISSLDAGAPFSAFCTMCDATGLANAAVLKLVGLRSGVIVATQIFDLSFGFNALLLSDPNWADVTRVVFEPLTAAGAPGVVAIDNINATAIPEPAALTLTGLGLLGLIAGYARRRSGRD